MVLLEYVKKNKFPVFFIFFIVFYCLYYGPYGYDDADNGYTLSLSWRIFNGQIPFRDFILVRPPLSPLLHTLPFYIIPEDFQIIFDRFLFYFFMAMSSLFAALAIDNGFELKKLNLNPYLLATIGFVLSVNNFPAMGWHTVDAIFFSSLGIYLLVCFSSLFAVVFGTLCLFLSALCKQPFYLMPFAGVAFVVIISKDWKKFIVSVLSLLICSGLFIYLLLSFHVLQNFIIFTTGSANLKDLLSAGYESYVQINIIYFIIPLMLWILVTKFSMFKLKRNVIPYFYFAFLLIPITELINSLSNTRSNQQ